MQRRDRFFAIVCSLLVLLSPSARRVGALAVDDPAWNKIVGAAKKEGKVVVFGPLRHPTSETPIRIGFQKKYPEIEVDFNSMRGAKWRRN